MVLINRLLVIGSMDWCKGKSYRKQKNIRKPSFLPSKVGVSCILFYGIGLYATIALA